MKFGRTVLLLSILLDSQTVCFKPAWIISKKPNSFSHREITETAILQASAEACRALARAEGRDFVLPTSGLTAESLAKACAASDSAKPFLNAIFAIKNWNTVTDLSPLFFIAELHFDNEKILAGREIIKLGLEAVKASVKLEYFETARVILGSMLHTLQDFYTHSNWIELGKRVPFSALIKPDAIITNIADETTPTCGNCDGQNCKNILPSIIEEQKLTTGYFSLNPFSSKPRGKCSHGGIFDGTTTSTTKGINKDDEDSIHGGLHLEAANVATNATIELLQDIRAAVGDRSFLRFMGITRSPSVLCFVIDTTGSMSDDIAEVKRVTLDIIDSTKGTPDEPPAYILVPFNDPDFGPLISTTDSDVFKAHINALTATGGGDFPELSLSGLQLALTSAPPSSTIFLFTDATAKDDYLRSTVLALIQSTQSVVNCLLTGVLGSGARKRRAANDNQQNQRLQFSSRSSTQLYQELAQASGGQAIQVSKTNLTQATSIIEDSTTSALVTIFQAVRNPGKAENFSFIVDDSLSKLTVYITGSSPIFTISSPAGVTQNNTESSGALGSIQNVGNFWTVRLNTTTEGGQWEISVDSTQAYSIKVIGQSGIDFLFEFVEIFTDLPEPVLQTLSGVPSANRNATLLLTVTGGDSVSVTEVMFVPTSGAQPVNSTVVKRDSEGYLVTVDRLPAVEFALHVKGINGASRTSHNLFQRQSSTQLRTSDVTVTASAQVNDTWEPGTDFTIPFTVTSNATGSNFTIRARNDREFNSSFPSSVTLDAEGRAEGTVTLTAPSNTSSGTGVTLTIEAEAPGATDSNYAVLRLAVIAEVTDISSPTCEVVSVNANCTGNCSLLSWQLSANLTDGNGTGIESITVRQGSGILNTTVVTGGDGVDVTVATYRASCCSEEVELVAVDAVGNVAICFRSIRPSNTTAEPLTTATSTVPASSMQTDSMTSQTTAPSTTSGGEIFLASPLSYSFSFIFFSIIKTMSR